MQKGSVDDTSNVLKNPEHVLTFIKHALENPRGTGMDLKPQTEARGIGIESLRIVPEEADEIDDGDSDDEEEGGLSEQGVDDITSTAVKLLLSVLEGELQQPAIVDSPNLSLQPILGYLHVVLLFSMNSSSCWIH